MQYQQSETTAERRRWIIVLVDSTDGTTGLTGQTGKAKISKNGGAAVDSTNDIVEVDAGDMPGHYYLELTAAELDTLGWISIVMKTAGSLAFHDRATVSYNDPYVSVGGFSGSVGEAKITKKQLDYIAEQVWEQVLDEKKAKEWLQQAATHPEVKFPEIPQTIVQPTDLTPVLDRIADLKFPVPKDYTATLENLAVLVEKTKELNLQPLQQTVEKFDASMKEATADIKLTLETVNEVKSGFEQLQQLVDEFNEKQAEMSDMDKRFENMTSIMQQQSLEDHKAKLEELAQKIDESLKKILITITKQKYELMGAE